MGQTALPDSQWTLLSLSFEDPSSIFLAAPPFMLISILWIFPVLLYAVSLGVVSQGWVTRLSPAGQGKMIFDWFSRAGAFPFTPTKAERASLTCSILIPPKSHLQDSLSLQMRLWWKMWAPLAGRNHRHTIAVCGSSDWRSSQSLLFDSAL